MQTQHNCVIKEKNATIITQVKDTLDESATICPNGNAVKTDDYIYASVDDPLHLELKEDNDFYEDAGNIAFEFDDGNELPTEENSTEK